MKTSNAVKNITLILSLGLNVLLIVGLWYLVHSLGGFSYMWFKMNHRGVTGTYELRKTVFEVMPKDTGTIVMVGNSLTEGCEWSELLDRPIKNRGIAGEITSGLLGRLPSITALQASRLFLMTGVNDLIFVGPEEVLVNYAKILDQLQRECPHTEVFVQSILPVNNKVRQNGIRNQDILAVNQAIAKMAEERGMTYLNLHTLLCDENGRLAAKFTHDGIHLNGEAYLLWKNAILPFLGEGLE